MEDEKKKKENQGEDRTSTGPTGTGPTGLGEKDEEAPEGWSEEEEKREKYQQEMLRKTINANNLYERMEVID